MYFRGFHPSCRNASPVLQSFTLRNISSGKPSRCILLSMAQDLIIFFLNRWLRTIERAGQLMSAWILPQPRVDPANLCKLPQHHFLIEETGCKWQFRPAFPFKLHMPPLPCVLEMYPSYLEFCPAQSLSGPWTALALLTGLVTKVLLFPQSERSWLCAHWVYVWRLGPSPCVRYNDLKSTLHSFSSYQKSYMSKPKILSCSQYTCWSPSWSLKWWWSVDSERFQR